jgi:hypothetical protein
MTMVWQMMVKGDQVKIEGLRTWILGQMILFGNSGGADDEDPWDIKGRERDGRC